MYGSPSRLRMEREAARRNQMSVVISSVLSLLVVGAAIAAVAWLVLRAPSSAVDSAERLEPIGTALPAPTEAPALPTAVPTREAEPEPTALGFTGEAPVVAGLPTVAAVEEAGPTPTPRVIAQPTAVPTVPPAPAPTLPPAAPAANVPVVALQPIEAAPPPAPTAAPRVQDVASQPTPAPDRGDDPFNIFDDTSESRIVPALDDPLQRVRDMQEEQRDGPVPAAASGANDDEERKRDPVVIPTIDIPDIVIPTPVITTSVPAADRPIVPGGNDPVEIVMPDVDAMIDEITARATDPSRNPNVNRGEDDRGGSSTSGTKRKSARDRINERNSRRTPTPTAGETIPGMPDIVPGVPRPGQEQGQGEEECDNPFAALPADKQPKNFPFDDC